MARDEWKGTAPRKPAIAASLSLSRLWLAFRRAGCCAIMRWAAMDPELLTIAVIGQASWTTTNDTQIDR